MNRPRKPLHVQDNEHLTERIKIMFRKNPLNKLTLSAEYQGIENRIKEVKVSLPASNSTKITGRFFYLDFKNREPNQDAFVEYMYSKLARYCIPRKEFAKARKLYKKTEDENVFYELHDRAIRLFVYSDKKNGAHLGEPAELIAFIILEAFFGAPQIASKMFLKTSRSMPVNGADAIHVRYHKKDDSLDLIWGEAKLYKNLNTGITDSVQSIKRFISYDEKTGDKPQNRDIEIIKDFPDVDDDAMRQAICDYFDPYSEKASKVKHIFTSLVGYDESLYKQLSVLNDSEIEDYFKKQYMSVALSAYSSFSFKVAKENMSELEFILILLPFKNVDSLREAFKSKLRLKPDDRKTM